MLVLIAYGFRSLWLPDVLNRAEQIKEYTSDETVDAEPTVEVTAEEIPNDGYEEAGEDDGEDDSYRSRQPEEASTSYDGRFGNQLDKTAREFYNAMVEQYVDTGYADSFEMTFYEPLSFDPQKETGEGSLSQMKNDLQYALQNSVDAFRYDYPQAFWLYSAGVSYQYTMYGIGENYTSGEIASATITPQTYQRSDSGEEASGYIAQFEAAVSQSVQEITEACGQEADRYTIVRTIHDYLCDRLTYRDADEQIVHTVLPVFAGDGGVVCEGYARAFKILCDRFDIPCICISGTGVTQEGSGSHMWNAVCMEDGAWYLTDVTWDDQQDRIRHQYFLTGTNTEGYYLPVSEDHIENTKFAENGMDFIYPALSLQTYGG